LILVISNILIFACCFFSALPGPPTNVRVSEITATSVRLTWSYAGAEELQYYVIQYKPKYANQPYSEISGIITMYYTVRTLSPYTEYELFVIAVNNIGRGPPSTPVIVTTGETGEPILLLFKLLEMGCILYNIFVLLHGIYRFLKKYKIRNMTKPMEIQTATRKQFKDMFGRKENLIFVDPEVL
jgi:hypothetical protein